MRQADPSVGCLRSLECLGEAAMNVQPDLQMDKAAFLAWADGRDGRYELAEGRVVMMTGGTMRHGMIVGNLFESLRRQLDRKRWVVLTEFGVDVGPRTIRYPDVVVDERGAKGRDLTAKAPVLVAEVLSPSSIQIDLGDKASEYLQLPNLAAYLVLAQDEIKTWAYVRGSGNFSAPQVAAGAHQYIGLPAFGLQLSLADIYADIEFD
ncbi:MAG: Uma2 family endonuclease [Hyphomicrobiales bacterium]|nr:Uma2 family endonuclease [Hyphomicrobiales bacterium]